MQLGTKIKVKRTEQMLSQTDLAKKIGCSLTWLNAIENNKKTPTIIFLTKVANALGVPASTLLSDDE